jgi:hypothetical protein
MCNQVRGFHRHGRTQRGGEEENYIFDFYNVTINYNLDIWDFFRHLGLTAPPPPRGKNLRTALFTVGSSGIIAKIQMTFPNCADINLYLLSYLFPSQIELKVIGHHNMCMRHKLKVVEHFVRRFSERI